MSHAARSRLAPAGALVPLVALVLAGTPLAAQTGVSPDSVDGALAITADDIRGYVEAVVHDSIGSRAIGSPGIERTARYVAEQFERLGLRPSASVQNVFHALAFRRPLPDTTSWIQRYILPGNLAPAYDQSLLRFAARPHRDGRVSLGSDGEALEHSATVTFAGGARFAVDTMPESGGMDRFRSNELAPMHVLTGRHTAATVRAAALTGDIVLYVPPAGTDSTAARQVIEALKDSRHVIAISDEDSATFARGRAARGARPPVIINQFMERFVGPRHWAAYVRGAEIASVLEVAGIDLTRVLADTAPTIRTVPAMNVFPVFRVMATVRDTATAVNTIAILPGTDSVLAKEFVVFTAHMDETDIAGPGSRPRVGNGANDNAAGVAGLLALAEAFSQPGARPRRSLLFVATSGTALGAAGANYLAGSEDLGRSVPTLLNITLDRIGRAPKDSVVVDGMDDIAFPTRPEWVAAQHPNVGLTLVDGGTIATAKSDHVAFVSRAVPSLLFYGSPHGKLDEVADTPEAMDAEQAARIVQLIYYIGREVANTGEWPRWTADGRARRLLFVGE